MTTVTHAASSGAMTEAPTLALTDGHDGESNAQRWLYELEHASLAQGQAAAAPSERSASHQASTPSGGSALQSVPASAMKQSVFFSAPTVAPSPVVDPLSTSSALQVLSFTATQHTDRVINVSEDALQSPLLTPPPMATTAVVTRATLGMQRAVTSAMFTDVQTQVKPYAPQNLHVYADADSLQVWVRDAQLAPEAAEALRAGFVDTAARAGTKTVKISINGKPATRPAPDALMTLPAKTGLIF